MTSGCGLGLHLSLQLAKFLDGDVQIESQQGVGTKAKIILNVCLSNNVASLNQASVHDMNSLSHKSHQRESLKCIYNKFKLANLT